MKKLLVAMCLVTLAVPAGAATWVVTNQAPDMGTPNSLGWCIMQANNNNGPDTIIFGIPNPTGGPITISPLQTYLLQAGRGDHTTIDGYTQVGAVPNSNPAPLPLNTQLMVEIDGSRIQGGAAVFRMEGNFSTIRGLAINSGPYFEITVGYQNPGLVGNHIAGNFIGTDVSGTVAKPSGWFALNPPTPYAIGVYILNGAVVTYVGSNGDDVDVELERNLISGETQDVWFAGHGVLLEGGQGAVVNNFIWGNLIGTTPNADTALPNNYGVTLLGGADTNFFDENVISGNNIDGVHGTRLQGSVAQRVVNNEFHLNYIGLDPNTGLPVPNGQDGVHFESGCDDNIFGSTDWAFGNTISGNMRHGIFITGGNGGSSTGNRFLFNFVGLDAMGDLAVPNGENGLHFEQTGGGNSIGDGVDGNIISGNMMHAVMLRRSSVNGVRSNFIGGSMPGFPRPNGGDGIRLECTDVGCSESNDIASNWIGGNLGNGITMDGFHINNTIGPDNVILFNEQAGIWSHLPDNSNQIVLNTIQGNGWDGIRLEGSSPDIVDNGILENDLWGILVAPHYGPTMNPVDWADDVMAVPRIVGNDIDDNSGGGIHGRDSEAASGPTLHLDNTIGTNGGNMDVLQQWWGAVEILDDALNPITSGPYTVSVGNALGMPVTGDAPDGGLWGPTGFRADNVSYWFLLTSYRVRPSGAFQAGNPHTVTVSGPYVGSRTYTFDGVNNDVDNGGPWPSGINTGGQFRYQVADVVTEPDTDLDGEPDITDCAPSDPGYQGPAGIPCDADGDGYCDDNISGVVQQAFCPNDICAGGLCAPTDCLDSDSSVNPGASEGAYGDPICADGIDNDCDGDTDSADSGCWQCFVDGDCDDGDVCNGAEVCLAGFCHGGTPLDCNDGDICTTDSCDPSSGCQYSFNTDPCDDGQWCTVSDTCNGAGTCTGSARDCSGAGDQCNTGVCDEGADACVAQPLPDDTGCDDGLFCTVGDACASGECLGAGRDCTSAGDQCNDGVCDEIANDCVAQPVADGTDCDDTLYCTVSDVCTTGACVGASRDCSAVGDQCNDGVCNETSDICETQPKPDFSVCDDGLFCTVDDECIGGACGGSARDCSTVADACNDGECDEGSDQCVQDPHPDGSACSDGDDCTVNDVCTGGVCDGDPLDVDADGHSPEACGGGDCDDANAGINPDAEEVCDDGIDQDCNGEDLDCGCEDLDVDGFESELCGGTDCDDQNAAINPDAEEICDDTIDNDCDGDTDADDEDCACPDADSDGFADDACGGEDCDDTNAGINPDAEEVCDDGIDQDCNGEDLQCGCADLDSDGFEDEACGGTDCDDGNADINPGADEVCDDSVDNDCNGDVDADDEACAVCADADSDGYEDIACGGTDCDDTDATINPGADEVCEDGIDQDCNGEDLQCGCPDADADGFEEESCGGSDCDDADATINPGADEVCNDGADNDCDGDVDGDDSDCICPDADSDGYTSDACGGEDCDDSEASVNPGASEVCDDTLDNDCDGAADSADDECECPDADGDGHADESCGGTDCDDGEAAVNPDAAEVCDDSVDNDCDGNIDEADDDCGDCVDADGDTHADEDCGGDDCDDADENVFPGAAELCDDGKDNDCDGLIDDDDTEDCERKSSGCDCGVTHRQGAGVLLGLLGLMLLVRRRR